MAQLNFIRGTIRGKIGQFVGSSWKGKSYIKTFTKPGNPRTVDQVAVRAVFYSVSQIAKAIYENVLKPYTFPKPRRITAYNRMIQINKPMFEDKAWNPDILKIFEGPLPNPGITTAALAGTTATVSFPTAGEAADKAVAVIFSEQTNAVIYQEGKRSDGTIAVSLAALDPAALGGSLHAYLVFSHAPVPGTDDKGSVSNTAHAVVTP